MRMISATFAVVITLLTIVTLGSTWSLAQSDACVLPPESDELVELVHNTLTQDAVFRLFEVSRNAYIPDIKEALGRNAELSLDQYLTAINSGFLDKVEGTVYAFVENPTGGDFLIERRAAESGFSFESGPVDPDELVQIWSSGAQCARRAFFLSVLTSS
jgi:hypothetical protein